jgi:hypothetical protein
MTPAARSALTSSLILLTLSLGAMSCAEQETTSDDPGESVGTEKAPLTLGSCALPAHFATERQYIYHVAMAGNTNSATAGDSLLSGSNITLTNNSGSNPTYSFEAGTTIIVGFQGLGQSAASVTGDTFIRLFDDTTGVPVEVAYGDDACGTYGSRIVYTVPQGSRMLRVRTGCYQNTACAGDLYVWSRFDSNGQLTDAVRALDSVVLGSDGNGNTSTGSIGGTSVRQLMNNNVASTDYEDSFFGNCCNHFEGVQRLRNLPGWVAIAGAKEADVFFGSTGGSGLATSSQAWLQSGSTTQGSLQYRYSNWAVQATGTLAFNVTDTNHAQQNTANVTFSVPVLPPTKFVPHPTTTIMASTSNAAGTTVNGADATGDTFIRLFNSSNVQVAQSDDISSTNRQSYLSLVVPGDGASYTLKVGCYSSNSCSGVAAYSPDTRTPNVSEFKHMGGIQAMGKYILAGTSNFDCGVTTFGCAHDNPWGRLFLLDAQNVTNVGPTGTMRKWILDPQVLSGVPGFGIGPSQVGITKATNGALIMAMSRNTQTTMDFYVKDIDEGSTVIHAGNTNVYGGFADIEDPTFGTPAAPNRLGWNVTNPATGVTNAADNDSIALVTETSGNIYLYTTKGNAGQRAAVQHVNAGSQYPYPYASLGEPIPLSTLIPSSPYIKPYQCQGGTGNCNFDGAAGFYINAYDDALNIFSTSKYMNSGPDNITVAEFTSNYAYGRTVFQSSGSSSYQSAQQQTLYYATDGVLDEHVAGQGSHNLTTTLSEANPWMYVDLGSAKSVKSVKIFPPRSGSSGIAPPWNFTVSTWNGSAWVGQVSHPAAMALGSPETLSFPNAVQTQFVLVQISGTGSLQFSELQVF